MTEGPRLRCVAIRSPRGAQVTEIDWGDGHKSAYPHEVLRGYCPCAGCQGHTGTIRFIECKGAQLEIEDFEVVGNYALRIQWFDGHGTGIYSYKYLRSICQCPDCRPNTPLGEHPRIPRA
jgi:DUF971 family protein